MTCPATLSHCRCAIPGTTGHVEHVCECGGSWAGDLNTPGFRIFALPSGTPINDQFPLDPITLLRNMRDVWDYRNGRE